MNVNSFKPQSQYMKYKEEYDTVINKVITEGKFISGPQVGLLERDLSNYINIKQDISGNSLYFGNPAKFIKNL